VVEAAAEEGRDDGARRDCVQTNSGGRPHGGTAAYPEREGSLRAGVRRVSTEVVPELARPVLVAGETGADDRVVGAGERRGVRRHGDGRRMLACCERIAQVGERRHGAEVIERDDRRRGLDVRSDAGAGDDTVQPSAAGAADLGCGGGAPLGPCQIGDDLRVAQVDPEDAVAGGLEARADRGADP